ncbi:hypothetical protein [Ruminococcus turbiniformis]
MEKRKEGTGMSRRLIIDGNAVYEVDEECMLRNRIDKKGREKRPEDGGAEKNRADGERHGTCSTKNVDF